jgi:alkanesulfonate monooxygenase SsuD/methylene tetrahydromethanopterin reductase-like flavin-dependent oxidoreductase (luciferase family)
VRLGTGIVSVFTRGPAVLAQQAAALADASRGRFVLGLGASSDVIVSRWNGIPFERPLARVRDTVAALRPVLAGERGPGGFKLEQAPASEVPIYLAALRDRMLELAGEVADGAFVNFLPLSAVEHVVAKIRDGEAAGGKEPGEVVSSASRSRSTRAWRSRAGCSPHTERCRSTRPSSARWAGATASTRWSRPGAPAIANARSSSRPTT